MLQEQLVEAGTKAAESAGTALATQAGKSLVEHALEGTQIHQTALKIIYYFNNQTIQGETAKQFKSLCGVITGEFQKSKNDLPVSCGNCFESLKYQEVGTNILKFDKVVNVIDLHRAESNLPARDGREHSNLARSLISFIAALDEIKSTSMNITKIIFGYVARVAATLNTNNLNLSEQKKVGLYLKKILILLQNDDNYFIAFSDSDQNMDAASSMERKISDWLLLIEESLEFEKIPTAINHFSKNQNNLVDKLWLILLTLTEGGNKKELTSVPSTVMNGQLSENTTTIVAFHPENPFRDLLCTVANYLHTKKMIKGQIFTPISRAQVKQYFKLSLEDRNCLFGSTSTVLHLLQKKSSDRTFMKLDDLESYPDSIIRLQKLAGWLTLHMWFASFMNGVRNLVSIGGQKKLAQEDASRIAQIIMHEVHKLFTSCKKDLNETAEKLRMSRSRNDHNLAEHNVLNHIQQAIEFIDLILENQVPVLANIEEHFSTLKQRIKNNVIDVEESVRLFINLCNDKAKLPTCDPLEIMENLSKHSAKPKAIMANPMSGTEPQNAATTSQTSSSSSVSSLQMTTSPMLRDFQDELTSFAVKAGYKFHLPNISATIRSETILEGKTYDVPSKTKTHEKRAEFFYGCLEILSNTLSESEKLIALQDIIASLTELERDQYDACFGDQNKEAKILKELIEKFGQTSYERLTALKTTNDNSSATTINIVSVAGAQQQSAVPQITVAPTTKNVGETKSILLAIKQNQEKDSAKYCLLEMAQFIDEAMHMLPDMAGKRGLFLLGPTGAGKSVIANHLLGMPLIRWNRDQMGDNEIIDGKKYPRKNGEIYLAPSISTQQRVLLPEISSGRSHTKVIQKYYTLDGKICVLDAPGLYDTNKNRRLAHELAFRELLKQDKSEITIAVVIDASTVFATRGETYINLAHSLGELFVASGLNPTTAEKKNVLFLFNRMPEFKSLLDVLIETTSIRQDLEQDLENESLALSIEERKATSDAIELCKAIERSTDQCQVVTLVDDQVKPNMPTIEENRLEIHRKYEQMSFLRSTQFKFDSIGNKVKGQLGKELQSYLRWMREEKLQRHVHTLSCDTLACLKKYEMLLADPAQWRKTIETDLEDLETKNNTNIPQLHNVEIKLEIDRKTLQQVNTPNEIVIHTLQALPKTWFDAATPGFQYGLSIFSGLMGAVLSVPMPVFGIVLLATSAGYMRLGYSNARTYEQDYSVDIPISRTAVVNIAPVGGVTDSYKFDKLVYGNNKTSFTVTFYYNADKPNEGLAIYVKKEHHPKFATTIATLRNAIQENQILESQLSRSIESAKKLIDTLQVLKSNSLTVEEFKNFITTAQDKEKQGQTLQSFQEFLYQHKHELAAVAYILNYMQLDVYDQAYMIEYADLVKRLPNIRKDVTLELKPYVASVIKPQSSIIPDVKGLKFIGCPPDGHCFYHAISQSTKIEYLSLREQVAAYMADKLAKEAGYRAIIDLQEQDCKKIAEETNPGTPYQVRTAEQYIAAVKVNAWAGDAERGAMQAILKRPIVVIYSDNTLGVPTSDLNDYFNAEPIFVHYQTEVRHFNALIPNDGVAPREIMQNFIKPFVSPLISGTMFNTGVRTGAAAPALAPRPSMSE